MPPDFVVNETLAETIRAYLYDGKLPCAAAFAVAQTCNASPLNVGRTADALQIHLTRCQLGLFGHTLEEKNHLVRCMNRRPHPRQVEKFMLTTYGPEGILSCLDAWIIADRFGIARAQVGSIADRLHLHICSCQLGAF